jgi:site-specific DNA recombinase
MNQKRAAAYCRVSTDKEDQLNSLETQRSYFQEHMQRNGYEMVCIYADEGISGTKKRNRKEFLRMLDDAGKGKFDVLFVKDVARFARNTLDSLESVRYLKKHNIDIVFVNNQGILETGSELVFTIMAAMAQEESVNTSKRVKFGKRQNMRNGKVPNLVYGYDKVPGELFQLYINEKEAATVRQIFERYVYEGEGCHAIAKSLNESGIRTKRGCLWSQNAISRILKNRIYIGQIVNGREATKEIYSYQRIKVDASQWLVTDNPKLQIVSAEIFEKAQTILEKRYAAFHLEGERQSNKYLFSTLIKCKNCGRSFRRVERTYTNTYVRWVCSSRNGDGMEACANAVRIKEDELLEAIRQYLLQWQGDKKNIIERTKREYKTICNLGEKGYNRIESLKQERQKLQRKLERLKEMYLDEVISRDEVKEKSQDLKGQLMQLDERLRGLEQENVTDEKLARLLEALFRNMDQILSADVITNEMLKQVIDRIEVDSSGNVDVIIKPISHIHLGATVPICDSST